MAFGNQVGEAQRGPPIAVQAVGVQLVPVGVQAGDGAQVDHTRDVARVGAHGPSLAAPVLG